MKKASNLLKFFSLILFASFLSCTKDKEVKPASTVTKSSEKITSSFKFSGFSPEIIGEINRTEKKITLIVPNGTDVTALVPTIEVSGKATVSPASGTAQNFTNPVKYSVTAEDGSKQEYEVTIKISTTVNFTLKPHVGPAVLQQDDFIFIYGTNFGTDPSKAKIIMENSLTGAIKELLPASLYTDESMFAHIPDDMPLATYKVKVAINNQSTYMAETFTIVTHRPSISEVSSTTVTQGGTITITGKYFSATNNTVKLTMGNTSTNLEVISQSATSIEAKVSSSQEVGDYTISVVSNNKEGFFGSNKITVTKTATAPVITSLDKTSYSRGETITITGHNLKKIGYSSNINFIPFYGGSTIVRSGIAKSDGTQITYTIPSDFPLDSYIIVVEVGLEFSEEYNEVIPVSAN